MKIKLVGRPGQVVQRGSTMVTTMAIGKAPALPGDLPAPPEAPVRYTIYIDEKQWHKVAVQLENPQDALVIEGHCFYDAELKTLTVLAQRVMSKLGAPAAKPAA